MTDVKIENGPEKEILSRDAARKLAEDHRKPGQSDPLPDIPPSLLSATHIEEYVVKTGAIGPFHIGGGRHSRLKKASYEGRIGKCAYIYNEQGRLESLDFSEELMVKANSIVFVECDLDFRLPDYIALRFNLQIRHVHRGLLLGTGPLVDPGYWGKLCIPLHNLTNEDYSIRRDDGLIWIEFTKTTAEHEDTSGRLPLDDKDGYWNIRDFIERAASPRTGTGESVPIRSSISEVIHEAKNAACNAEKAQRSAKDAKNETTRMRFNITLIGVIAALSLVLSILFFLFTIHSSLTLRVDDLQSRFSYIESVSTDRELRGLPSATKKLMKEISTLRERVGYLEKIFSDEGKSFRQ